MRPFALMIAALTFPLALPAAAQTAPAERSIVDGPAVAAEVKRLLQVHYVLPEMRPKLARVIDQGIANRRYEVRDTDLLVSRINEDLGSVISDKHLGVMNDPARSKALAATAVDGSNDDRPPTKDEIRAAELQNHGLVQMKVLPGNVRYLEIESFDWVGAPSERAYDTAMNFLAGGDAAIIDVRRNGGGSPEAVRYAVSHFLAPNRPLMTFYMGGRGTQSTASLATTRAPRMIGKPLYVLSSNGSASAAEEFLGHIAGFKLGDVVGQRSAGAGFRNDHFALPSGLIISISVGRAVLAATGKDWEGVGIAPTIDAPVDKALDVATVRALRQVAARAAPQRKAQLTAIAAALDAQINPVRTELPIDAYAGVYGERSVQRTESGLTIQRGENPPSLLVPIAPNKFAYVLDPAATVSFLISDGKATALHLVRSDGSEDHGVRTR